MNLVKSIMLLSFFISGALKSMDSFRVSESIQSGGVSLKRFPAYYYTMGARLSCAGKLEDRSFGIGINNCSKHVVNLILSSMSSALRATELLNFCVALRVAQATLLTMSVQEWTLEDLKKIQALIMHNIGDDFGKGLFINDNLGKFKKKLGVLFKKTTNEVDFKLMDCEEKGAVMVVLQKLNSLPLARVSECLTLEEQKLYDKYFVRISDCCDVPLHMEEYLKNLKDLAKSTTDHFEIATFAHVRLTQIHPFSNGDGRLARLLLSCILMQAGEYPFISDEKVYALMVKDGDQNTCNFKKVLQGWMTIHKPFFEGTKDLEGNSLTEACAYDNEIQLAFSALWLDGDDFILQIESLKSKVINLLGIEAPQVISNYKVNRETGTIKAKEEVLNIFIQKNLPTQSCGVCAKKDDMLQCGRCKTVYYCSVLCQRKD
nr:Fic family protein [Candidatus Dependentiae bacterium]